MRVGQKSNLFSSALVVALLLVTAGTLSDYFLRVSHDADIDDGAVLFVAYPVEYRLFGVMTFVVTSDDVVFQKDLGPDTPKLARTVSKDTPDSSWQLAE